MMTRLFQWSIGSLALSVAMGLASVSHAVTLTPPDAASLALWLRADTGVTADGSGFVSQWDDQSGKGNHVTQGTAANQPQLVSTSYGFQTTPFPALKFDGGDLLGRSSGLTSFPNTTTGATIFIVLRATTGTGSTNHVSLTYGTNNTNRLTMGLAPTINFNARLRGSGGTDAGPSITTFTPTTADYYLEAVSWAAHASGTVPFNFSTLRHDGSATGQLASVATTTVGSTNISTWSNLFIGGMGTIASGAGTTHVGEISEVLVWNSQLSAEDQVNVGAYLATKYGLVPEPASIFMACIGICGLSFIGLKRRK